MTRWRDASQPTAFDLAFVAVEQGRVVIGERPGLSSPDSLGIYLTWAPQVGTTDAARNCISNVRPAGLSVDAAATTLHALLRQARLKQLTGVGLKDEVDHQVQDLTSTVAEVRAHGHALR